MRVERMIGPYPVSSSRTTMLATNAVSANMKNTSMIAVSWMIAKGAFLNTAPPEPICTCEIVVAAKVSRKKTMAATQKTGERS